MSIAHYQKHSINCILAEFKAGVNSGGFRAIARYFMSSDARGLVRAASPFGRRSLRYQTTIINWVKQVEGRMNPQTAVNTVRIRLYAAITFEPERLRRLP